MLEPCSYCLRNKLKALHWQLWVDSESRNQTAKNIFKENKLSEEIDSQLTYCETFPDAVHVDKRKRENFANWFLYVDGERTNLVPPRTLRNDTLVRDEICSHLRLNSVRNSDCQDVKPLDELGSPEIRLILSGSLNKTYTYTCT